jgi:CheY-like chemotaxis protein
MFRIYLNYDAAPGLAADTVPSPQRSLSGSATILVVEDELTVRTVIKRTLGRLGYSILEATDGEGGLAVMKTDAIIDLLITDVMMPGMNGHLFAEKALTERPGLPVIFVSGYSPSNISELSSPASPHAFLQKPFRVSQLAEMVSDVLQGDNVKHDRRTLA